MLLLALSACGWEDWVVGCTLPMPLVMEGRRGSHVLSTDGTMLAKFEVGGTMGRTVESSPPVTVAPSSSVIEICGLHNILRREATCWRWSSWWQECSITSSEMQLRPGGGGDDRWCWGLVHSATTLGGKMLMVTWSSGIPETISEYSYFKSKNNRALTDF